MWCMLLPLRCTVSAHSGQHELFEFIPKSGSPVAEFYWGLDSEEMPVPLGTIECEVQAGTRERRVSRRPSSQKL